MISSTDNPSACSLTAPGSRHSMVRFRVCTALFLSCLIVSKASSENVQIRCFVAWNRTGSDEGLTIPADEFLNCHRLAAADFSDIVVGAGKDALTVVHGAFTQVLHQERFRRTAGKCTRIAVHGHRGVLSGSLGAVADDFKELLYRNLLVRDLLTDHATDDRRDLWMGELDRTEKRVGLSEVRCRVLEYRDNKASLVLGCDRSVSPCCIKRREHSTLADHRREVEQPFGEERRSEMDRRYTRPIEYALA